MGKRLTYEYVKSYIESEGYKLLSDSYTNNSSYLMVKCPMGHEYKVKFGNFKSGYRCSICSNNHRAKEQSLGYEYVKSYIESTGYTLLSDSYKNCDSKLTIKCPMGHEFIKDFSHFRNGQKCTTCSNINSSERQSFDYDYVKSYIELIGYTLLSDTYKNNRTKLVVRCNKGHEYEVTFGNFCLGKRCPECNVTKLRSDRQHSYDYVKQFIENESYTLLSDSYTNNQTVLQVRCDKGHEHNTTFGRFQQGHRCPQCWVESKSSRAEREVQDLVKSIIPGVICNDRTQIVNPLTGWNLELDIWIPSMRKAIEYNGLHWHNDSYVKIKDTIKLEQCRELDIDLLIIEDVEWINNNTTCKNNLLNFLKG